MKGLDTIKAFLESGEPLSKDSLPSRGPGEVDREALIHTIMTFHKALCASSLDKDAVQELQVTLKKANATTNQQQPASAATAGITSASPPAPAGEQSEQSHGDSSSKKEKPEEELLCRSMWGMKACVGRDVCPRQHLDLCTDPVCFGNEEHRKACASGKWHGHIKGAIRAEKKKERKKAEERRLHLEQRKFRELQPKFQEWLKQKGNEARGSRGDPPRKKPPQNPAKNPPQQKQQGSQGGQPQQGQQRVKRGPSTPMIRDFVPKHQALTYAQAAAGAAIPMSRASTPVMTQMMAPTDAKSQITSLLQSLTVLMQQVL